MRIKLTIEYYGKNFVGWQKQENLRSVQGEIETALEKILQEKVEIFGSGRTDAGVNARGQVAHFDTNKDIEPRKIKSALNYHLPKDIAISNAEQVDDNFHARHSAKRKTYCYKMYVADYESPLLEPYYTKLWHNVDVEAMCDACKYFVGEYDFIGFCEFNPQVYNTVRKIYDCHIERKDNLLHFYITGNGFLHKMVRVIVGTIIAVGQRKISVSSIPEIIASCDRMRAGETAPAKGLTLESVEYSI